MPEVTLNYLLIEQEDWWVAQCIEYDIGAQAGTLNDLMYQLQRNLIGYLAICAENEQEPFRALPTAPRKYWKMWESARTAVAPDAMPFRSPVIGHPKTEIRLAQVA